MKPLALTLFFGCCVLSAQRSLIELLEEKTLAEIRKLDESAPGVIGMAAIDLKTRRSFSYHGDTQFAQASSIKIPILIEIYRAAAAGKFRMSDELTLSANDAVGGSGHLRELLLKGPKTLTIKQLVTAMMETSDNTATNQCIRMAGMANVNRTLDEYGFPRTRLQRIMMDSEAARREEENISTPNEMVRLADLLYRGQAVSSEASSEMLDIMRLVKAHFKTAIPNTDIASKPGGIPGVKCETGIIYLKNRPFALSVMTTFVPASSTSVEQVAAIVHRHFLQLSKSNTYGNQTEP